jgi:hypothetical protein
MIRFLMDTNEAGRTFHRPHTVYRTSTVLAVRIVPR